MRHLFRRRHQFGPLSSVLPRHGRRSQVVRVTVLLSVIASGPSSRMSRAGSVNATRLVVTLSRPQKITLTRIHGKRPSSQRVNLLLHDR